MLDNSFSSLKKSGIGDFSAGFSVSLIALPLCLGISIASGFPPLAGLVTAMVGGVIASRFSGSYVTISGPAAGLIVIALAAAENLGGAGIVNNYAGYPYALAAMVIGGLLVILGGIFKVGKIGDVFPPAVVHGMMAGIGIIIILKQLFPFFGLITPDGDILSTVLALPALWENPNLLITSIGLASILVLVLQPKYAKGVWNKIPAPLWVLLLTIPFSAYLGLKNGGELTLWGTSFEVGKQYLVTIPSNYFGDGGLQLPDFSKIGLWPFWSAVISVALVSGVESLLSAKAVDDIDPLHRTTNLNKDLVAMGSGTSIAAMIGGLPMISEIVRSKANVENGAKTQWANFFHGLFLFIYLIVLTSVIELIPLSALAAMLIYTGYRLAAPSEFIHMKEIGWQELSIFLVTLIGVVTIDLLMGVLGGLLFKFVILMLRGVPFRDLFSIHAEYIEKEGEATVKVHSRGVLFTNVLSLKKTMDIAFVAKGDIIFDCNDVHLIDHCSMVQLDRYEARLHELGRKLIWVNDGHLKPDSLHPQSQRTINRR